MQKTKLKTEWDLTLFYKNEKDPQIERDVIALENQYSAFAKKYKDSTNYLYNENDLLKALRDWDELTRVASVWKPVMYFHYMKDLDATNSIAESMSNKIVSRLTGAANSILFFTLKLGKIEKKLQQQFLMSSKLKDFHYFLKVIFEQSEHDLSELEEKVLNLKSLPAYSMWLNGQEKLLNIQTVLFEGKKLPIPEAMNILSDLPTKKRRKLYDDTMSVLKGIAQFAESELNAIYTDKKINDELRGFKEPYAATFLQYQNDEESILGLVNTVTKHFPIAHRFYKLKAKLMKLPYLECVDKSASIGKTKKKLSIAEGIDITMKAFQKVDSKYADYFLAYLKNGQIDFMPKKGKSGGAYCSGNIELPTFVFLNYIGSVDSVMTLGHEMGHAFHYELSKKQSPIYQNYTIPVAEVASTFFENIIFEELFEKMSEKEKIVALHDRITDDISTIFRQIAAFNWELELHREVREKGALSKERIVALHNMHMKSYLGPIFRMKDTDGYTFVQWPHLRFYFYVYAYAYGQLISKALYAEYKKDKSFLTKIEEFLSAGGSKSPYDIFKDIGIDTSKPAFFEAGLKSIEEDIKRLEKLTKNNK